MHNIEKSSVRKGQYIGYADGAWRISRPSANSLWRATHSKYSAMWAKTLPEMSKKLSAFEMSIYPHLKKNPLEKSPKTMIDPFTGKRVKRKSHKALAGDYPLDRIFMVEIELYADNNAELHRQRFIPIIKNIMRKIKSGKYNALLAPKLWRYYYDDAAKRYQKEFGMSNLLGTKERQALADKKAKEEYEKIMDGEYSVLRNNPVKRKRKVKKTFSGLLKKAKVRLAKKNPTARGSVTYFIAGLYQGKNWFLTERDTFSDKIRDRKSFINLVEAKSVADKYASMFPEMKFGIGDIRG